MKEIPEEKTAPAKVTKTAKGKKSKEKIQAEDLAEQVIGRRRRTRK